MVSLAGSVVGCAFGVKRLRLPVQSEPFAMARGQNSMNTLGQRFEPG